MSQLRGDQGKGRPHHRRTSCVGLGLIKQCLVGKIAECECDVLQPQPACLEQFLSFHNAGAKPAKFHGSALCKSQTLLPPSVTRTLCLWKDEKEDEYHLTVYRKETDEVFLDLPLSGILARKLTYSRNHNQWHEIAIGDGSVHPPQRLVFNLKSSPFSPGEVEDFNNKLNDVFEVIGRSDRAEGEEGENSLLIYFGEENPAIQDVTKSQLAGRESMSSILLPTDMAMSKPQGAPSLAASNFPSTLSVNRPYAPLPENTAQQMSVALSAAIQAGNVKKAQDVALLLAQSHTPVSVNFDAAMRERKAREKEISVTVHVEDRESAGLILNEVKVRPSDTILDLKRTFLGKYGFPPEVQKWIIGNRICGDEEMLSKCEINCSGHTLYLYLLSARAVNISREDYKQQWQAHSPDYESMHFPIGPPQAMVQTATASSHDMPLARHQGQGQPGGASRQQSKLSTASSSSSLIPGLLGLADPQGHPDPGVELTLGQQGGDLRHGQEGQGGTLAAAVAGQSLLVASGGGGEGKQQLQQPLEVISHQEEEVTPQGWQCETCTLINQPTRPGCEACGSPRPADYQVPSSYVVSEEERERLKREQELEAIMQQQELLERENNYQRLLQVDNSDLVTNTVTFTCPICFDDITPGEGIILRECLHQFCKSCLTDAVRHTEEAELKCPFQDNDYSCNASLQDREVRALVPDQVYQRFLRRSLDLAESQEVNSYHCKTPDCQGWCIYEDLVNFFRCPVCRHENCLTCRAIHEGMNCKQYQEDLLIRAANDQAAQQTQVMLQDMLEKGEAMPCPKCKVIVQKKDGCDWIRCSICKTEICWVTRGPRWGPNGGGDTSGGCRCRVGGQRCHPRCNNCH